VNDKRKKILYVESNVDGTIGGSYFSLLYLIQGLDKTKYIPEVAFYRENELIERYEKAGCKVHIINKAMPLSFCKRNNNHDAPNKVSSIYGPPLLAGQKLINYFRLFLLPSFQCIGFIKREKIDLIHLNNTLLRPQEWILASLFTNSHVVAHERGINDSYPFLYRLNAKRLEAIFCISKSVENRLLASGFPKKQLHLVYNGLDPEEFTISKSKESIMNEFELNISDPVIGLIGNIKPWKGQGLMVRAMDLIVEKMPNVRCLIIGSWAESAQDYYDHICKLISERNLEKNIIITGYRSDVPCLINVLRVVVHASIRPEPFGRVLLEGMVLRKPVVTPDIGAGPEIVVDGKTGSVFTSGDPRSLADAILYLLENPQVAEKMGNAGHKRVVEHFHIRRNIKSIESIYASIFNNQPLFSSRTVEAD